MNKIKTVEDLKQVVSEQEHIIDLLLADLKKLARVNETHAEYWHDRVSEHRE